MVTMHAQRSFANPLLFPISLYCKDLNVFQIGKINNPENFKKILKKWRILHKTSIHNHWDTQSISLSLSQDWLSQGVKQTTRTQASNIDAADFGSF